MSHESAPYIYQHSHIVITACFLCHLCLNINVDDQLYCFLKQFAHPSSHQTLSKFSFYSPKLGCRIVFEKRE